MIGIQYIFLISGGEISEIPSSAAVFLGIRKSVIRLFFHGWRLFMSLESGGRINPHRLWQ
jgi:hypothetical protein